MPDFIQRLPEGSFLLQWYTWGVFASFVIALLATIGIFADAHTTGEDATLWKSLAAVAGVLSIPALLTRLHAGFAYEMRGSLDLVAYLSVLGLALAVVSGVAHVTTRRQAANPCPVCGRPLQPGWAQCPYHAAAPPIAALPIGQPGSVNLPGGTIPVVSMPPPGVPQFRPPPGGERQTVNDPTLAPGPTAEKPTVVAGGPGIGHLRPGDGPGKTVILRRDEPPKVIAFLVLASGPNAGRTFALSGEVTKIGRDGRLCDYVVDDPAVGGQHLSIRYQDGEFVATDLDTLNGTRINGSPIVKHTLAPDDAIVLGETKLVFMRVPGAQPKAADPASRASEQ
ncbi:MAG: FHA domain-containing protein [Chloroflexi bacterium]|nr:FHA domain-containing protein [Chloroflexota bacterium]